MRPCGFQSPKCIRLLELGVVAVPTRCTSKHGLIVTSHPYTVRLTCRCERPATLELWNGNYIKTMRPQHSKMYIINDATVKSVCIYHLLRSWDRDNALEALSVWIIRIHLYLWSKNHSFNMFGLAMASRHKHWLPWNSHASHTSMLHCKLNCCESAIKFQIYSRVFILYPV